MPSKKAVLYDPNRVAASSVRDRVRAKREVFDKLLPEMKARAFTAAGMENMAALARVQEAVAKVPEGGDWKSARKQIAAELVGEWDAQAKKAKVDPATLAAAARRRAETILQVNVSQARAVSRYAEQQAFKEDFPYLMYETVGDSRSRPSHAALDGKILPVDDPFWKDHYPPWEFGCRCIAIGITAEEAEAKGVMTPDEKRKFEIDNPPAPGSYHNSPAELKIPLDEIVSGKSPEEAAYFAGTAIDHRVTLPDGTEQSVWRWSLDIKPGLDGAEAAARKHVAEQLVLDGIGADSPARIEALNKATEAFSAARVALKQPKLPEFGVTYKKNVYAEVVSDRVGNPGSINFNPDEFQRLEETFQHDVVDRLEAGKVRYSAIPSAEEAAKSIAFHEFGHVVFNRSSLKDKEVRLVETYHMAISSGDIDSVSEYAKETKSGSEFFAEVFAMYKNGEYLPDYVLKLIKEIVL